MTKKGFNITRAIDNLWKYCRKQLGGPGFLINEPLSVSPLAKKKTDNPNLVERFHVIIAGSELGNGYSELNDPLDQAERFEQQQKLRDQGDDEAQMNDEEFVEALEYGMPPTCGFGMSERVFSFFMDKPGRECQIFPLMKPRHGQSNESAQSKETSEATPDLGIDRKTAEELGAKYMTEQSTKTHSLESAAIMQGLAKRFSQDEEKWWIIGYLHDLDWDLTKADPREHSLKTAEILKGSGASDFLIETIMSHNYGYEPSEQLREKSRSTQIQHCLAAAETLTGIIYAAAMMQPDKKLSSVKLSSLKKKFKDKKFAANCNREIILECEKCGLSIDEFLEIGLKAMQGIASELGL